MNQIMEMSKQVQVVTIEDDDDDDDEPEVITLENWFRLLIC